MASSSNKSPATAILDRIDLFHQIMLLEIINKKRNKNFLPVPDDLFYESSLSDSDDDESKNERPKKKIRLSKNSKEDILSKYSDSEFKQKFSINKITFKKILEILSPIIKREVQSKISNEKLILIVITFLTSTYSYKELGTQFKIPEKAIESVIPKIINCIKNHSNSFITLSSQQEAEQSELSYFQAKGIRNVCGIIDHTHIEIINCEENLTNYINFKGVPSILLQGVIDHNKRFINIQCGDPGSTSCINLLKSSDLYKKLEEDSSTLYGYFLLGNASYMNLEWLVPPFKDINGGLTEDQIHFNYLHAAIRCDIDQAFGLLRGRFKRLQHFQNFKKDFVIKSVIAAVCLHNICVDNNDMDGIPCDIEEDLPSAQLIEAEDLNLEPRNSRREVVFDQMFDV